MLAFLVPEIHTMKPNAQRTLAKQAKTNDGQCHASFFCNQTSINVHRLLTRQPTFYTQSTMQHWVIQIDCYCFPYARIIGSSLISPSRSDMADISPPLTRLTPLSTSVPSRISFLAPAICLHSPLMFVSL